MQSWTDRTSRTKLSVPTVQAQVGQDPAADTEIFVQVPVGERWLVKAVHVELVQGITQTPWPRLIIDRGANGEIVHAAHSGTAAQAASTTCQHVWAAGGNTLGPLGATTEVVSHGALPVDLILESGWRIATVTAGKGANTNYGAPSVIHQKLPAA